MTTYRVKISAPCEKTPWKAFVYESNIDAESLNDLIDKALSQGDIEAGARIIAIDRYTKQKGWIKIQL